MRAIAAGILATLVSLSAPWATAAAACPSPDQLPIVGGEPLSDLDDLIDRVVTGSDGRPVGTVWDVTLDRCRTPQDIVVTEEGALDRKVAIPISRIRTVTDDNRLELKDVTVAEAHTLPPFHTEGSMTSLAGRQ
ncbi:PRC-barrel domain-containing protein [Azospirillum canadense]|uniref:PRC-barrel domain-containing protein n=1 Tax=Azospirillum canadense TaxID=403962 RepID=UPI002226349B|nr:PRC-barrel domain-containing protein [Azospirillum canadense]MCW2242885.1 sporulation protein YlmC with PRC-barrel domain [Azospirillum canadense]